MGEAGPALIAAEGVGKRYWIREQRQSLVESLYRRVRGARRSPQAFWALRDVSVTLAAGESLGIVGSNGAGKTTLLKILGGITRPSAGRAEVRARASIQFGLGAGFHPYLTGRENAFLQGTILGLTNEEIRHRFPSIVAFAGLGGVVDRPLWTYSSGMAARLGFAVAIHVDFDVLLLDEALSAGDARFRRRCQERLLALRAAGKVLVAVSHGSESVRELCDRVLWLETGQVRMLGPAGDVMHAYEAASRAAEAGPAGPGPG